MVAGSCAPSCAGVSRLYTCFVCHFVSLINEVVLWISLFLYALSVCVQLFTTMTVSGRAWLGTSMRNCAQLCAPLRNCAHLCTTVRTFARLCAHLHNCAHLCTTVRTFAQLCAPLHNCAHLCATVRTFAQLCTPVRCHKTLELGAQNLN